jgi:hypothetical protein
MHVYSGVDCKECKSFIAQREIVAGAADSQPAGEYRLSCAQGHVNTYTAGEFYTLESETTYTLPPPPRQRDNQSRALLFAALLVALLMLIAWLMISVFLK